MTSLTLYYDVTVGKQFLVRASYLEVYMEDVRDLLSKNHGEKLTIKEKPNTGVYVKVWHVVDICVVKVWHVVDICVVAHLLLYHPPFYYNVTLPSTMLMKLEKVKKNYSKKKLVKEMGSGRICR